MRDGMIHATFLMEQHIGHRAYYENLRRFVDQTPQVDATWVEINYQPAGTLWQRLPLAPCGLRGTLAGRQQARQGMKIPADILFFNTQVPAALSGNPGRRQPYIIATDITPLQYDRMAYWYRHKPDRFKPLKGLKHSQNKRIFRNAAYLLPWSSWACRSLIEEYGADPGAVDVLPPGVNLEIWRPGESRHPGETRPDPRFRILFVGGDFARKGGEILLQAYRALCQAFPPGQLELVLVTRSPVPQIPGVQVYSSLQPNSPELIHLYQSCDAFVLPSLSEAFGVAAVEASAAGLPVIATKVGGLADIVEDGVTGRLIESGEVQPLVEALSALAGDPARREQMGRAGRARAAQRFNAAQNAARVVQIIAGIVQKGKRHAV